MENYWKTKQASGMESKRSGSSPDFPTPTSDQPDGWGCCQDSPFASAIARSTASFSQLGGPCALSSGRDWVPPQAIGTGLPAGVGAVGPVQTSRGGRDGHGAGGEQAPYSGGKGAPQRVPGPLGWRSERPRSGRSQRPGRDVADSREAARRASVPLLSPLAPQPRASSASPLEGEMEGRAPLHLLLSFSWGFSHTAPEEDTPAPWRLATEAPKPPEGPRLGTLAVSEVSPDSLRLSWRVAQGPFDSFVVQYQDADGQPQALLVGGDQSKVLVSGLEPSTSYTFFLHGLHEGKRLGPVSAEGTTGTRGRLCILASNLELRGRGGCPEAVTIGKGREGAVEGGPRTKSL